MSKAYRMVEGKLKLVEVEGCATCGNTAGVFKVIGDKQYCRGKCARDFSNGQTAKNLWNFESMNIGDNPNAGPVKVNSLRHLRQLEREHGVVSVAANYDEKNWERR